MSAALALEALRGDLSLSNVVLKTNHMWGND
jgi:hypothetical protein